MENQRFTKIINIIVVPILSSGIICYLIAMGCLSAAYQQLVENPKLLQELDASYGWSVSGILIGAITLNVIRIMMLSMAIACIVTCGKTGDVDLQILALKCSANFFGCLILVTEAGNVGMSILLTMSATTTTHPVANLLYMCWFSFIGVVAVAFCIGYVAVLCFSLFMVCLMSCLIACYNQPEPAPRHMPPPPRHMPQPMPSDTPRGLPDAEPVPGSPVLVPVKPINRHDIDQFEHDSVSTASDDPYQDEV